MQKHGTGFIGGPPRFQYKCAFPAIKDRTEMWDLFPLICPLLICIYIYINIYTFKYVASKVKLI